MAKVGLAKVGFDPFMQLQRNFSLDFDAFTQKHHECQAWRCRRTFRDDGRTFEVHSGVTIRDPRLQHSSGQRETWREQSSKVGGRECCTTDRTSSARGYFTLSKRSDHQGRGVCCACDPVSLDSRATVLCLGGISAFDMISRAAMVDGLHQVRGGDKAFPFVLQFYSEPSQYFWTDDCGDTHVIHQGEGSEQGDALMPMLFALGQHGALLSLHKHRHTARRNNVQISSANRARLR